VSEGPRVLQSVDRSARVLTLLAQEAEGLGLGEMADRMGLKPQTLQGIVRSLQAHGLVLQLRRGGRYSLGPRIHELSRTWLSRCDRAALARDAVRELADTIGEGVLLSELRGERLLGLVQVNADQPLSVSQDQLHPAPLHTTATGKILLAFLPEAERDALIATQDYRPRTPKTIASPEALREELTRVADQEVAVCEDEAYDGVSAAGVPIRDVNGHVTAAIGASLPSTRWMPEHAEMILENLRRVARDIEVLWGRA